MGVSAALEPLAEALLADGYELHAIESAEHVARIEVVPTDDACPDCLVPREIFAGIVRTRLGEVLHGTWTVDVVYPDDAT